jgi:hypothetical protein
MATYYIGMDVTICKHKNTSQNKLKINILKKILLLATGDAQPWPLTNYM